MLATYFSSSTVGVASTTNSANYKVGDTVILSGLVFDGATPIVGANATAAVSTPVPLGSQTSLGNYQLVGENSINSNLTDYSYSVTLTAKNAAGVASEHFQIEVST